jgi:hypothetical protein
MIALAIPTKVKMAFLGQRGRILPADEQVDGEREARRQAAEAIVDVVRLERRGA